MRVLDPDGMPPLNDVDGNRVSVDAPNAYWSYGTVSRTGIVHISGQVAWDEDGETVGEEDIARQAEKALEHFGTVLEAAGATPQDVLKVTAYVTDMDDVHKIAEVRHDFFDGHTPASSIVEVDSLYTDDLLVEIEGVAELPE